MEEDDETNLLDYRTPKGQLIRLLGQKLKKPEIDNCLGEVLEKFSDLVDKQTTYLDNGIFHMNFAEDALLLQNCGLLYAKKVDKLWDCLLDFHKRMVSYDESIVNNSGDRNKKEARQLELAKLEERLNRGKRKKITLVDQQPPQDDSLEGPDLFDRTDLLEDSGLDQDIPFDFNFEIVDEWKEIQKICNAERKRQKSVLVEQYNRQQYRLRPYILPFGNDIVYDLNDCDEFNTREGRLIACQHIRHLFEYNDRCLLPDEDLTIAKLRFAYILKKKWLVKNNIDPNAPYDTYKEAYEKYQNEYVQVEKRKIQNMPQRTGEDLLRFFKVLERKEEQAIETQMKMRKCGVQDLPNISFENLILEPLKEGYQGDYDPYIPDDIDIAGDHETELSNLFVDSSKTLEADSWNKDKLRSDSGYFDGGFEADDDSGEEEDGNAVDSINVTGDSGIQNTVSESLLESGNIEEGDLNSVQNGSTNDSTVFSSSEQLSSVIRSDSVEERVITNDGIIEKTDDVVAIIYNKDDHVPIDSNSKPVMIALQMENLGDKQEAIRSKIIIKGVSKNQEQKRKIDVVKKPFDSPKRRKLSEKQIEQLKKGRTRRPVNHLKFESFYSYNYQPENGEGVIQQIEYESDSDDSDNLDNNEAVGIDTTHNTSGYHSEHGEDCSPADADSPPSPRSSEQCGLNLPTLHENQIEGSLIMDPSMDFMSEIRKNSGISREVLSACDQGNEEKTKQEKEREKAKERVTQWKEFITPKLKQLNENDFDIHQYGSHIIGNMVENETKHFGDLVKGKSSAEVVRYFISTLQLANTMNVEVCGAKQGELSNDTFHIKLLSKERYHEHIQEYQAPSIETFKHKLEKVKQIEKHAKLLGAKSKKPHASKPKPTQLYEKTPNIRQKSLSFKNTSVSQDSAITPPSNYLSEFDHRQPSTSRQADDIDRLFESGSSVKRKFKESRSSSSSSLKRVRNLDYSATPNSARPDERNQRSNLSRFSTDSGFMASFDDDFDSPSIDQTPLRPAKILNIHLQRHTESQSLLGSNIDKEKPH